MRILSNKDLDEQQRSAQINETDLLEEQKVVPEIVRYVRDCWDKAKRHKEDTKDQILANMRQINGEYDPDKLAKIREVEAPEIFMMITDVKTRNAEAWLKDLLFQPNARPWGISPTPIPDLPDDVEADIFNGIADTILGVALNQVMQSGGVLNKQMIMSEMAEAFEVMREEAISSLNRIAKEKAEEMELKIDDQLTEGGFYEAFKKTIPDIILHTGIIKGPVNRKKKIKQMQKDPKTGRIVMKTKEKIVGEYERRHPLFIYPAPGAKTIDDGFLIDLVAYTPKQIQELIGQPGFNEDAINTILEQVTYTKFKEYTDVDQTIADINKESQMAVWDSDTVDCIEFHGAIKGQYLLDWGMKKKKIPDANRWYDCTAWIIGDQCIKAVLNKDPLGHKPFSKCSFVNKNESFWGKGLPEIIGDVQQVCNAAARNIVYNMGMGSGPQIERNIDRIPPGDIANKKIRPWKVWDSTETALSTQPAFKFYAPPMVVERLMTVYSAFSKLADEHSGIPAYAHGDPSVGGAGNTASGLSMLISSAARGIKLLMQEIDENIVAPLIRRQYEWNIEQKENYDLICDYNIVAKGTTALLAKEQQATRKLEALQITNNPVDMQIVGMPGRKQLLRDVLKSLDVDIDKILPEEKFESLMAAPAMQQGPAPAGMITAGPGGPPNPAMRTLDASGAPAQGVDTAKPTGANM